MTETPAWFPPGHLQEHVRLFAGGLRGQNLQPPGHGEQRHLELPQQDRARQGAGAVHRRGHQLEC